MRSVTKDTFFKTVNPLNVHPRVDVATLKARHHVSYWEMQDGTRAVIGRSESDSHGVDDTRYFLS